MSSCKSITRSTRTSYSLGPRRHGSHRRRLSWTLAYFLTASEQIARTYLPLQHWHAVPGLFDKFANRPCYARATRYLAYASLPVFSCRSHRRDAFSFVRVFFICAERLASWRERGRNSLFWSLFLSTRDQGWTASPCNIFIIFACGGKRKIVCLLFLS